MKQFKFNRFAPLALGTVLLLGAVQSANAQASSSATANGSAQIVAAIAITANDNLMFGQIVADTSGGTVTVTPAGVRTFPGHTLITNQSGLANSAVGAASFSITGMPGYAYSITLPTLDTTSPVTITSGSGEGAPSMTLDTFKSATLSGTATLSESGTDTLTVGANLNVGPSQVAGFYTGSFSVTVNYS
ncbi:MAG: DUF4402 domain-containing protein [Fimbriimonas sp.]|nr:DUF4402 domain-containing protein [Fimbriimonas sp.]